MWLHGQDCGICLSSVCRLLGSPGGRTIALAQTHGKVQGYTTKTAHIASLPPSLCKPWSIVEQYLQSGEQQHHSSWPGQHFLLPWFCVMLEQYCRRFLMLVLPLLPVIAFLQTVLLGWYPPQRPYPSTVLQTQTCWASYNRPQGGRLPTSYLC